jgi:hypothetical protein
MADAEQQGATAARQIALEWSQTSSRFQDEADFQRDWGSFKSKRGGVTIGTLIDAAAQDGMDLDPWRDASFTAAAPDDTGVHHPADHSLPRVLKAGGSNKIVDDIQDALVGGLRNSINAAIRSCVAPEQIKASDLDQPTASGLSRSPLII